MRSNAFASAAALTAIVMTSAPLSAAELPRAAMPGASVATDVFAAPKVNVHQYRYRHHNRIDAGDVIGAAVVLGAIAAVASAVDNGNRDRDGAYRDPPRYPERPYADPRPHDDYRSPAPDARYGGGRGVNEAVEACAREVERNARIGMIDNVARAGDGWHVSGQLSTGAPFECSIAANGQIGGIDCGQGSVHRGSDAADGSADAQWDDERYAAARAQTDARSDEETAPQTNDAPEDRDDGRYDAAQSPDFSG